MITDTTDWARNRPKESALQTYLSLTDDELRACVPYQAPRIYSLCPNCSQKENGRDYSRRHYPHGVFDFDPKRPSQITCSTCKEVYPDNPKFPQPHTRQFRAPRMWADLAENGMVTVRWHQQTRPPRDTSKLKPGEDGTWVAYFYMDGALDTRRDVFCQRAMQTLTKAYYYYSHNEADKDSDKAYKCAWKTAVILDGYANALPRWLLCDNYGKDYFSCGTKGPFPYGWSETRYGTARQTSEQHGPGFFRHALDITCESQAFADYGKNHKPSDYEHLFVKEGEAPSKEYTLSFYEKLCRNALMPVRRYQGSVLGKWGQGCPINGTQDYARLTHNREMLRLAAQSMFVFPHKSFFVDAGYSEGPGYSGIHLLHTHKGIFKQRGYTDPPQYQVPANSPNQAFWAKMLLPEDMPWLGCLVDYDPLRPNKEAKYEKFWKRAFSVWKELCAPNGGQYALGESGHRNLGSYRHIMTDPRHVTGHVLKTGMKRFLLGDGEGDDQVQINLTAGPYTAHGHTDFLDLQIFDNGHYLADDFGYGKHQMRSRYSSIQVHNSGAYDTFNVPSNNGIPWMYESNVPGIAVTRVGTHRETEEMERFERTVALISTDIKHPYVLDLFYFRGKGNADKGRRREYFFHTTKHHEQVARNSLAMKKLPGQRGMLELEGQKWEESMLNAKGYGVFFDAMEGDASQTFTVDFEVKDPWKPLMWKFDPKRSDKTVEIKGKTPNSALPYKARDDSWAEKPAIGIRRHVLGFPGQKAYAYNFPHPSKLYKNKHSEGWGRIPGFLMRHEVTVTSADTEFLVVHEAWAGRPYITGVSRLPKEYGSANAIALEIAMPGRTDIIVMSNDNEEATFRGAGIDFKGRFGIIVRQGDKSDAALIGGTRLVSKSAGIEYSLSTGAYIGTITRSEREWRGQEDGFYVDKELPESVVGSWMMVNVIGKSTKRNEKEENLDKIIGAGWAFRIAGVKRKNGKAFVLTEGEHGLEIKDSSCREFFKPHNHIVGATEFRIFPHLSNQGLVKVSPEGGPQAGPTQVTMKAQSGIKGATVQYLTVPLDAPNVYSVDDKSLDWQTCTGPVTIDRTCRMLVRAIPKNGLKTPVAQRFEFVMPPQPAKVDPVTLNPLPVTVKRYYKRNESNIEEPEVRMFYKRGNPPERGRHIHGLGFLKVSKAGKYTFHFHSQREGKLVIGGVTLFDGDEPSGEAGTCYLKPGYYDFEFVSKGTHRFDFEWRGPDFKRRKLAPADLFHEQAMLEKYLHEFKTQKKMR
ncbi:MAG: hypothetical protein QF473_19650 [Planctomycetota bacterium]|nr:hypothetical protein [Planctomycetota bacterium]